MEKARMHKLFYNTVQGSEINEGIYKFISHSGEKRQMCRNHSILLNEVFNNGQS